MIGLDIEGLTEGLAKDERNLVRARRRLAILEAGGTVGNLTLKNARQCVDSLEKCIANKRALLAPPAPPIFNVRLEVTPAVTIVNCYRAKDFNLTPHE